MNWIVSMIKPIMVVSGALTCTMLYAAVAPHAALRATFGPTASLEGPLAEIIVRNWGALIALTGAMLIYGAFNAASRPLVLAVASASKVTFIALVLWCGREFLGAQAMVPVVGDSIMVVLFASYLMATRRA